MQRDKEVTIQRTDKEATIHREHGSKQIVIWLEPNRITFDSK